MNRELMNKDGRALMQEKENERLRNLDFSKTPEARIAALEAKCAALELQAKSWAMEAKAQKATVHECLQLASGATGEKADWNGSQPVADRITALEAALKPFADAADSIQREGVTMRDVIWPADLRRAKAALEGK